MMLGYFGLLLVVLSSLPAALGVGALPPLYINFLILVGSLFLTIGAYKDKMYLYSIASGIGFVLQSFVLFRILGLL